MAVFEQRSIPKIWRKGRFSLVTREELGNIQATMICHLGMVFHSLGYFFTIEKPKGSYVWLYEPMLRLIECLGSDCMIVDFDQCYYGLQLPAAAPCEFCKKSTRLLGNTPTLKYLSQPCPGKSATHVHDHAFGSAAVCTAGGKKQTLSKTGAAGIYPVGFCRPWARLAGAHLKIKFGPGNNSWCGHRCRQGLA